jgi:hypothetical protein
VLAMSFSASVADIKAELDDIQQLLATRVNPNKKAPSPTESSLVKSLVQKIGFLVAFSTQDAADLSSSIQDSQLHADSKDDLVQAVDSRLVAGASLACISTKPQYLTDINNYLTDAEWLSLNRSDLSYQSKVQIIIERLISLQIHSLHEQTVKYCIALLLAVQFKGQGWPSYSSIHNMVVDFKKCFAASEKRGTPRLIQYPPVADKLPEALFTEAYPDPSHPPVCREVERTRVIANAHVPLRSTSALLKKEANQAQAVISPSASPTAAASSANTVQSGLEPFLQILASALLGAVGKSSAAVQNNTQHLAADGVSTPATDVAASLTFTPARTLAITDSDRITPPKVACPGTAAGAVGSGLPLRSQAAAQESNAEPLAAKEKATVATSQVLEDRLFQSLRNKRKGDSEKAASNKVLKRPAAATASKKVADYNVTADGADSMTKACYTSKHYHAAHKLAKAQGKDDYAAKVAARAAYTEAVKVWAQHN